MGKTLVVAEKPSVAEDYARALGGAFDKREGYLESDRYVVSWAVGHLVGLAPPEDYDEGLKRWSIKTLPILPERFQLQPDAKGQKQLAVLGKLMKRHDVDDVVNGCDAGREGELIFAYIYEWVGAEKPVKRLWVSSMTRDAVREGFEQLRPGADLAHLAEAARSRSEADWLVGMNATRAATVRGRALGGVVSLGRVQTPTLALIVGRDAQIDAFQPETYYLVEARFALNGPDVRRYKGRWFSGPDERIAERERAERVASAADGAACRVESVKRTSRRERAPLLYDLTSLQREANSRFGITATRTLAAAQRLYEGSTAGALLTYPRTRSRFLPGDQVPQLQTTAAQLAGYPQHRRAAEYVAGLASLPLERVVDDARVDDHHAIIPTGELASKALSGDDARIYDLVVRRFLAVFHPDARWEDTEIVTEAGAWSSPAGAPLTRSCRPTRPTAIQPRAPTHRRTISCCRRSPTTTAAAARRRWPRRSRPGRRPATARHRFSRRWRPPASRSRTTSSARP
jgi:DNA topoisomerase-3